MNDERERPTVRQPLNAEKRPWTPILWVVLVLLLVLAAFAVTGWLRYTT
ncbi:hypothetical protein [Nocardioides silvaticus]|nr:hypothetical protein [Nocardioides silvaticus]